jgi:hypothetical protein
MSDPHHEGHRRAALALHSISDADRDWILGQVDDRERAVLRHLLGELQDLGMQPDSSFLPDSLGGEQAVDVAPEAWTDVELKRVACLLAAESAGLIAFALAAFPPATRDRVLEYLPLHRRSGVARLLANDIEARARSRTSRLLLEHLMTQMAQVPRASAIDPRANAGARFFAQLPRKLAELLR